MHIGINNLVLYIDYLQKVNLPQKSNGLHINGKGYAKENKDLCRFGFQVCPLQKQTNIIRRTT